jgi:peptide/nickel transport system permease protein
MAQEVAAPIALEQERTQRASRWRKGLFLIRHHPLGFFGLLCVALLFGAGILADLVAPWDPLEPTRKDRVVGTLVEPVSADDTTMKFEKLRGGLGSTAFLDDEQVRIEFFLSESDIAEVEVTRGTNNTEPAAHDAGASYQLRGAVDDLQKPSLEHPFGTDRLGRDVLSRTIWGARISLLIGLVSVVVGISLGSFFGIVSGYMGGIVDTIIQRFVDMLLAFPALVLLLAIITVVGDESSDVRQAIDDVLSPVMASDGSFWGIPVFVDIFVVSVGIGVAVAVGTARIVRGAVLSLKENVYIEAARSIGASSQRIMWSHIFPNVAALVVILASIFLPIAILAESAISFLGVGVPDPTPSWGADLSEKNRDDALQGKWWPAFFPGLALSLVVLGFNMLGDAFRDISDPRLRGGMGSGPGGGGGRGGMGGL